MNLAPPASKAGSDTSRPDKPRRHDVVEIGVLLPAARARALMDLSRRRREPVGQILRGLIECALREG